MKCQNCGNNEANYHYRSNVNGRITEQHLCSECAGSMEGSVFAGAGANLMQEYNSLFSSPMMGGFFSDSFFGNSMRMMDQMTRGFFSEPRALWGTVPQQEQMSPGVAAEPNEGNIPTEAPEGLKWRRQLNQLRQELKTAVEGENFERAAQLRDEIHRMEKEHKED